MAWRRIGDKTLFEPVLVSLPTHRCVTRPQWVKLLPQANETLMKPWLNMLLAIGLRSAKQSTPEFYWIYCDPWAEISVPPFPRYYYRTYCGFLSTPTKKSFDRMPHGLLIAKLHACGLSDDACNMIISYLKDWRQIMKVMGEFSDCATINRGVPQGSVMGPHLFNIFLDDLFHVDMNCEIANYADDNHLYYAGNCAITLKNVLENDTRAAIAWFENNYMDANPDKFQSIILNTGGDVSISISVQDDQTATYDDLLKRSNFFSLKAFRSRCLAVEVYKCVHGLNPTYLNDLFTEPLANYNFRDTCGLHQPQFHTYTYEFKSFRYAGSKLWNSLPCAIKNTNDINEFKKNITEWCQTCDLSKLEIFWSPFPFQIQAFTMHPFVTFTGVVY